MPQSPQYRATSCSCLGGKGKGSVGGGRAGFGRTVSFRVARLAAGFSDWRYARRGGRGGGRLGGIVPRG
ncbi:MAG TPA: hypothetical protein VEO73_09110 [Gemmatimonadales bacterium]|nr:hypothetical protein [Gemmatimonadales bacterium]